uniref:Uncharacterized protein n=1 Tax=Cajanus cajan TaxID=3821 RepID=A0A151RIY4_CAJCA|nr:hypothetical protein KK1_036064 [Cajanus cajan]
MAHTKSSGQMTSESANQIVEKINELDKQASQGSFVPDGRQDILNTALGRPEHPGRVRATRVGTTIGQYYGRRQSHGLSMARLTLKDVICPGSLFGVGAGDFVFYITFNDIRELIERQMLNISIIQFWIFYLNQKIEEHGYDDLYGFLEPQYTQ